MYGTQNCTMPLCTEKGHFDCCHFKSFPSLPYQQHMKSWRARVRTARDERLEPLSLPFFAPPFFHPQALSPRSASTLPFTAFSSGRDASDSIHNPASTGTSSSCNVLSQVHTKVGVTAVEGSLLGAGGDPSAPVDIQAALEILTRLLQRSQQEQHSQPGHLISQVGTILMMCLFVQRYESRSPPPPEFTHDYSGSQRAHF